MEGFKDERAGSTLGGLYGYCGFWCAKQVNGTTAGCNSTSRERALRTLCEGTGGYHAERIESIREKELGCEKHHRRDEGLGVFCLGSAHDKYLLENMHYRLTLLFYSSIMYSLQ